MKNFLSDNRLFIKIFFWFWLATLLINGIFFVLPVIVSSEYFPGGWRVVTETALNIYGQSAAEIYERDGSEAAKNYLEKVESGAKVRSFLLNSENKEIANRDLPKNIDGIINRVLAKNEPQFESENISTLFSARKISTAKGTYIFLNEIPRNFAYSIFAADPQVRIFRFSLILLTSFLVCFWLTRYLTTPIIKLNQAAQQLATGDLTTRIGFIFGKRKDELTNLSQNFDQMAEQLENLIKAQSRLLGDISHELRSPLARLRVAATLARDGNKIEVEEAIDVIEREAANINEMIDQLMTLTRLETLNQDVNFTEINLGQVVREIAEDADFETLNKNKTIKIVELQDYKIKGESKLLRSAIENVVRNAIKYTAKNAAVEIKVDEEYKMIVLSIRDYGEGVPETSLNNLFQPFYRVEDDRDRLSGGTGLGLAIAKRAVKIHHGKISAENAVGGGLLVKIILPKIE